MPAQYYDPQNPTGARHPRRHTNPPVRQSAPAPASGNYAGYSSPSAYAASGSGSSGLHPHVALAAAHSGAVLDRVVSGLTPTMRSLAPKAVALAHHENLPASILLGVAQVNDLAHPQGLVKVARRLKAADFHGQPHVAISKVAPDVSKVLMAAAALHPLDKVPNPHDAHPAPPKPRVPRVLPGLNRNQSRIATKVLRQGVKAGATRKELLAGTETGLVESTFHNYAGGEGTSRGWRQETLQSRYPNPRGVKASAARYFAETASAGRGKGQTPGQLAQTVQGSAYPERYDQAKAQAVPILKAFLGGKPRASALPKGYVTPVKGGATGRTDMGVDFSGAGAQIRAIGKARVVKLGGSGWPEGGGVVYQLLDGPRKGKYVYNYEGLTPTVKVGQVVKAGQQVASLTGSSIEIGWSDSAGTPLGHPSNTGQALPASHYTKQGAHFAKFIGGTAPAPTTGSASLLSGSMSSAAAPAGVAGTPSTTGRARRAGSSGGSGSLNSLLAALLPADFRAGPRVGQSPLADLLASGNRPLRRLRTGR